MSSRRAQAKEAFLVADSRESAVIPFLDGELGDFSFVVRQVTVGDFNLCRGGAVLACVERKTLDDFAASIVDGRYGNVEKMLGLRRATGCQLYFFVEGPAFPAPSRRFNRVPYRAINTACTHLMMRDGIHVVQTEDAAHTARRLGDFLTAFEDLGAGAGGGPGGGSGGGSGGAGGSGGGSGGGGAGGSGGGSGGAGGSGGGGAGDGGGPLPPELPAFCSGEARAVPAELTRAAERCPATEAAVMWASLPGVTLPTGRVLAGRFSASELAQGRVGPAEIAALRTAQGRALSKKALEALAELARGEPAAARTLLAGIRGITAATAGSLLDAAGGLAALCAADAAEFVLPGKGGGRRFGAKRAGALRAALDYCARGAPGGGAPGGEAPGGGAGGEAPGGGAPGPAPGALTAEELERLGELLAL